MSPIIEAMKPSPNSDRQSCASLGELFPKNGTAFATESPTTFVSSRPTIFGSSRRPGITGKLTGNFRYYGANATNREFSNAYQGIFFGEQGNVIQRERDAVIAVR